MGVAALVLGILGLVIFSWLGPVLGVVWLTTTLFGNPGEVDTTPLWVLGLAVGVAVPLLPVVIGVVGLTRGHNKGLCITGLTSGAVGACVGTFLTIWLAGQAYDEAKNALGTQIQDVQAVQQMRDLQDQLDDPDLQAQLLEQLQLAGGGEPKADSSPDAGQADASSH